MKLVCLNCGYDKGDGQEMAVFNEENKIVLQCTKCGSLRIRMVENANDNK
jgi:uncharacterized Zn finger protein